MKFIISICLLLMPLITSYGENKQTEERKLGPFNKIIAAQGINVILIEEDKEQAVIKIQNASPSDVVTIIKGTTLKVRMKAKLQKGVSVIVEVSYKNLIEIEANTGATIETKHQVFGDKLTLTATTAGKIMAKAEVTKLKITSGQGSQVFADGKCDKLDCAVNTGGMINANKLTAKTANARVLGGGRCEVRVIKNITASATAGGRIIYYGNPEHEKIKTTLGGVIEKKSYNKPYGEDLIRDK